MKKFSVKTIVAIGIGAALFFVLGRFVAIPSPIPNTNISSQYGLLAFMAAVFGPLAGFLIGLIGHALIDFSWGGSFGGIWWSWVIASAVCGLIMGLASKKLDLSGGRFNGKDIVRFNVTQIIANIHCNYRNSSLPCLCQIKASEGQFGRRERRLIRPADGRSYIKF